MPFQPAPSVDAAQDQAKRAFEALPEAERKAVQEGLVWTGDYKGVADGRFGKGTREAITAFALRSKLPGNGSLDEKGRAALASTAQRAKAAVRFTLASDERTGTKIGLPLKLLSKSSAIKDGTRYASPDNTASLETSLTRENEATLEQRFEALRNETTQRKITYKVLRPEFFVVAGEAAGTVFYTRFARGEQAGEKMLSGYTLTYPIAAKATYDTIAVAIANSFAPFAGSPRVAEPARNVADTAPARPNLVANGLIVASGLVMTSLPANGCRNVQILGHPAKLVLQGKTDGLALFEVANATAPAIGVREGGVAGDLPVVVLAYAARTATPGRDNAGLEDLVASPGLVRSNPTGLRVSSSAQGVRAGSAVFDRSGALIGVLAAETEPEKRIGDVALLVSRRTIPAATLVEFLGANRPKEMTNSAAAAERSLGDVVAASRSALVAVYCGS